MCGRALVCFWHEPDLCVVRSSVANGGKPDMAQTANSVEIDSVSKSAFMQPVKVAPRPPAPQPSECQREITFVLGFQSRCANSVARRLDKPTSKLNVRIS